MHIININNMKYHVLGRDVEGDEHGVQYLDAIDAEAEHLFKEAKIHHRAEFHDSHGRKYIMTRESAGHYLVALINN